MVAGQVNARKQAYRDRLVGYINEYNNILLVTADNVGSYQMQKVRISLRNKAVVLMGKNTMIRMIIRSQLKSKPSLERLLPHIQGNVGLIFTNESLKEIRDIVQEIVEPAAAKPGTIAQCDVTVEPGPTGMDPGQTSFFQSLNIATKIQRGQIEIVTKVYLLKEGDKVGNSEAALLDKLNVRPFKYGLKATVAFENGSVYHHSIMDMTDDQLCAKFFAGVNKIAAICLRIGYPTAASIPHTIAGGFKKLLALSVATDYTFEESKDIKLYLEDPEKWAEEHGVAAAAPAEEKPKEEEAAPAEESESESSDGGGMGGLFGSDSD